MDKINQAKAEIFDILVQQEQLQKQVQMLEQLKQQKIQALNQLVQETKEDQIEVINA